MKNTNKNELKKYLLGDNENLIGTIYAFRKGLVRKEYLDFTTAVQNDGWDSVGQTNFIPESYAVILYLDHRLGRVVRYIFNYNKKYWDRKPQVINFPRYNLGEELKNTKDYDVLNLSSSILRGDDLNETLKDYNINNVNLPPFQYNIQETDGVKEIGFSPKVILDRRKSLNKNERDHLFKLLVNGKISSKMIHLFLHQLIERYLLELPKTPLYSTSDMALLHDNLIPNYDNKPFIQYPTGNKIIYYPKSIKIQSRLIEEMERDLNITLVKRDTNESPQVFLDLKRFINPELVKNKKFLDTRIEMFNDLLHKRLLENPI